MSDRSRNPESRLTTGAISAADIPQVILLHIGSEETEPRDPTGHPSDNQPCAPLGKQHHHPIASGLPTVDLGFLTKVMSGL
jgi:hypothetical protein